MNKNLLCIVDGNRSKSYLLNNYDDNDLVFYIILALPKDIASYRICDVTLNALQLSITGLVDDKIEIKFGLLYITYLIFYCYVYHKKNILRKYLQL